MRYIVSFIFSLTVFAWSVRIMASYVADRVHGYWGPTAMAFDTSVCLALLSVVGMILSKGRIKNHEGQE